MTTTELTSPTEDELILSWRLERLQHAGYDNLQALEIALRGDVDLHLATELLDRGCPPATALRILL
jgi:hypothetical protein